MSKMGWQEGQGLGKEGKGRTELLKTKKKTNFSGVGQAKDGDQWSVAQAMFSNVLQKLQAVHADSEAPEPTVKDEGEPAYNSTHAVTSFVARQGLYGRFRKAKDAKNYSEVHMGEILGRKPTEAEAEAEAEAKVENDSKSEWKSDLVVKTSNVSMRDYFASKIKSSSKKVTKFQTASGSGFSLDAQADYYSQMMDKSVHGRGGLGFGASKAESKALKGQGSRVTLQDEQSGTPLSSNLKVDHTDTESERGGLGLGFVSSITEKESNAGIPDIEQPKKKKKKRKGTQSTMEVVEIKKSDSALDTSSNSVVELGRKKKTKKG